MSEAQKGADMFLIDLAKRQEAVLKDLIDETTNRIATYNYLPDKPLTSRSGNGSSNPYYYEESYNKGKAELIPIGRADSDDVIKRKRRRYLKELLKVLKADLAAIEQFLDHFSDYSPEAIQKQLPKVYRDEEHLYSGTEPVPDPAAAYRHLPESIYRDRRFKELLKWAAEDYPKNPYPLPDKPNISRDGTPFRSKGECMWYDNILFEGLPVSTDPELELPGKSGQWHKLYPDFLFKCFDQSILAVEHFGKWDDERYAERNKRKIQEYLDCGFVLGDNLIVTSDNADHCTNELIMIEALEKIKKRMFG